MSAVKSESFDSPKKGGGSGVGERGFGTTLLKVTGGPAPIYQIIFESPDFKTLSALVRTDIPFAVSGITRDQNLRVFPPDGRERLILNLQMTKPVMHHCFIAYPDVNVLVCVLYMNHVSDIGTEEFSICEWKNGKLHVLGH